MVIPVKECSFLQTVSFFGSLVFIAGIFVLYIKCIENTLRYFLSFKEGISDSQSMCCIMDGVPSLLSNCGWLLTNISLAMELPACVLLPVVTHLLNAHQPSSQESSDICCSDCQKHSQQVIFFQQTSFQSPCGILLSNKFAKLSTEGDSRKQMLQGGFLVFKH